MEKIKKDDSYAHILKYTGVFGGVQGLNILVGIVRNKLVAMILGPAGMGLMSLFNSTIKLISDSTNLGIPMSAVREISDAYENGNMHKIEHIVKLIRVWSFLTAVLGMMVCIVMSPLLNKWTFNWGDHTIHFIFLSPVVALTAIMGGELAILKGTRQLKHLAVLSVYGVLGALVTSTPLYNIWKEQAIVPSLIIIALVQLLFTILYSYRIFPLRLQFQRKLIGEGMGMAKLGVAFVIAGIFGSGAEFLIRTFLNNAGSLWHVGLYNAGYMMTMTYAAMVFQAMETDYYPRLSSIQGIGEKLNLVVNRQVEVSLLLVSPLLVLFLVGLPILLPLLYSGKFLPVMGMMKLAILAMYVRAVVLPIEYIALSKGDSKAYLLQELVYDVMVVSCVTMGYHIWGLVGTGVGLLISGMIGLLFDLIFCHVKYQFHLSRTVILYGAIHVPIGFCTYLMSLSIHGFWYWLLGILLIIASFVVSIQILHSKSHLWESLMAKVKAKLRK